MAVKFTDEQQAVIDARNCNILVSAAAGSGKTAVLVERIIQMISENIDIDHLLVVTFTKAAASQMREKITFAIQNKLLEDPENKHLQKQETLIHNAQITTIDSFCQYVLKNNFNTIGIDPSFHVGDDGELRLLQEEVMKDMLEEEYLLAESTENSDFLYCMNYFSPGHSDKQVEEYISALYKFAMSMPWPEDWLMERLSDYDIKDIEFDSIPWVKDCVELAKRYIKEMAQNLEIAEKVCCESDGPYMYGDMLESEKDSVLALLQYDTYDALFDALRTFSFGRLSAKKDDSVNPDKREYVKELRDKVKKRRETLVENYFALPSGAVADQMLLCDRAIKELCRLAIRFKQLFDEKKREKQIIDFSDMEHFALQILVEHPDKEECEGLTAYEIIEKCRPSVVALEYRDYYKEVLIDEYQDSNNVQELILRSISGDIPVKSERFMVGDVKQSIYKFRLARPEIFMEKLHTYSKEKGADDHRIDLHKNFRSRKEVLEATNYIFEKIMGKDLGSVEYDEDARLVTGASYPEPSFDVSPELIMFDNESDPDSELAAFDAKEKEALVIAKRIHELMKENPELKFKDMVILLRSISGWDDVFKRVLAEQGIPAYTESKSGYFDAGEVATILELLSIVDNPSQDIPLVSVMHSPIGGFTDEELAKLRITVDSDERLSGEYSFYSSLKKLDELSEHSDEKLSSFISFIEGLREKTVYTPVHELLQYILDTTGYDSYCLAMPNGVQRKANLDMLLLKALSFEKSSFKGLFHFVRYIEHMKIAQVDYGEAGLFDENADVVRIMSIHKSKGLEFPVVFVSGTTKGFNEMDIKKDLIIDMDHGLGVRCIDLDNRVKYDTLKRLMIADKMRTDNLGEELRVLYVALTRAKEKLIMTAAVKKLPDKIFQTIKKTKSFALGETLLPYSERAGAGSYFDLILSSLVRHPEFGAVLDKLQLPRNSYDECKDSGAVPSFKFYYLSDGEITGNIIKNDTLALVKKEKLMGNELEVDDELIGRLRVKFESKYAHEKLKGLFTKTTVTELKKHRLEEIGEVFDAPAEYEAEYEDDLEIEFDGSHNLDVNKGKKHKKLTGAERGTAYHRVMEILDDAIYGDEKLMQEAKGLENINGGLETVSKLPEMQAMHGGKQTNVSRNVYSWLLGMIDKKMVPEEYRSCIWTPDIATFLSTDLGQRMGKAYREGKLVREKPFMMGISANELNPQFPEDEMVLIQGIIDAWFMEGDDIVLMDYKTDKVKDASELIRRYQIQLDLYKRALEATTKKKVKEIYIYSFGLGCEIKL